MPWEYTPYVLPLIIAAAMSAALALYTWRRRPAPGAAPFALLMLAVAQYTLGYALELGSTDLPTKVLWSKVEYLGIVLVPAAWLAFALQYTGRERWLTPRNLVLLAIDPLVTLLLVWTNDVHGLIWSTIRLDTSGLFSVLDVTYGAWAWVRTTYVYLLLILGTVLLLQALLRSPRPYRGQLVALLIGALAPWVGNALYISGSSPFPHLDLAPFAYTLTGVAVTWSLFRFRLLDIVPVARNAIIEGMSDGVIVLDVQDRIVDLNPTAERVIGHTASEIIGQLMMQVFSGWPEGSIVSEGASASPEATLAKVLVEHHRDETEIQTEIVVGGVQRIYDLRIVPLHDRRDRLTGRLVVLRDITERKRAEEALRESELQHRTTIDSMADAIHVLDTDLRFILFNTAFKQWNEELGLETDMIGRTLSEAFPFLPSRVYDEYHWVFDAGKTLATEETSQVGGRAIITETRKIPVFEGGRVVQVVTLVHDITERKQAEEALRASEERFRALYEDNPSMYFTVDAEGTVLSVNWFGAGQLGYTVEELVGQPVLDVFYEDDKEAVQQQLAMCLQNPAEIAHWEFRKVRKDGSMLWVKEAVRAVRGADGKPVVLVVCEDITERKQAEDALRESEARYRTLVTQAPIGVVTCDRAGNITHVNPALLQILGSPGEEATRQFDMLTMLNLVEAGIAADFRRCIEEATQITAEYLYRSYWGKESIIRLRLAPLRDESGAVSGALAIVEDVTEQRRLQEQLLQSAKLASIGELAAGVAHEINNPINGIINYAQLLLNRANETEPGSRQARFLEGILREGDRVTNIVRDLLTFARVETEAHSPAHVPDILQAILTLTGQQLKKDGISLEIEEQPDLPQIKCRSQRIQQVFLNLISNARDALNARYPESDPNKRLVIRIEEVEKDGQIYVQIAFRDCGVGIPAQNLPHVFTPFFTTKRPDVGTGLGLSVSYGIVQDHQGDIRVESVEGEYTVFRVDLPVDPGWEM